MTFVPIGMFDREDKTNKIYSFFFLYISDIFIETT